MHADDIDSDWNTWITTLSSSLKKLNEIAERSSNHAKEVLYNFIPVTSPPLKSNHFVDLFEDKYVLSIA